MDSLRRAFGALGVPFNLYNRRRLGRAEAASFGIYREISLLPYYSAIHLVLKQIRLGEATDLADAALLLALTRGWTMLVENLIVMGATVKHPVGMVVAMDCPLR